MPNRQISLLFLVLTIRTFSIDIGENSFITRGEAIELKGALAEDPLFKNLEQVEVLGKGSYGIVLKMMSNIEGNLHNAIAVKISNDHKIDKMPDKITEKDLDLYPRSGSNIVTNIGFERYLEQFGDVPFLPKTITDRNILLYGYKKNSFTPQVLIKNVWAQELGDYNNLSKYADKTMFPKDSKTKYEFVVDIMFKLTYAMSKIVSHDIIHGDIKLQNIFLKKCTVFKDNDICPIIGDWDLGYHYSKDNVSGTIRYSPFFVPPEMTYFKADYGNKQCNKMFISDGGFTYSGKEDVYALGVSLVELLRQLGIFYTKKDKITFGITKDDANLFNGVIEIAQKMIAPMPIKKVLEMFTSTTKKEIDYLRINFLKKYIRPNLSPAYIDNLKSMEKHLDKLYQNLRFKALCPIKTVLNEVEEKSYNPAILYYHTMECLKHLKISDSNLLRLLGISDIKVYTDLKTVINNTDPWKELLDKRSSMADAANGFSDLLKPILKRNRKIGSADIELGALLPKSTVTNPLDVGNRNIVHLGKSFLDATIDNKLKICKNLTQDYLDRLTEQVMLESESARPSLVHGTIESICEALIWIKHRPKINQSESEGTPQASHIQKMNSMPSSPKRLLTKIAPLEKIPNRDGEPQKQQISDSQVKRRSLGEFNTPFDELEDPEEFRPSNLENPILGNQYTFRIQNKFLNDNPNLQIEGLANPGQPKLVIKQGSVYDNNNRSGSIPYFFRAQDQDKNSIKIASKPLNKSGSIDNLFLKAFKGFGGLFKQPGDNTDAQVNNGLAKNQFVGRNRLAAVSEANEIKPMHGRITQNSIFNEFYVPKVGKRHIL